MNKRINQSFVISNSTIIDSEQSINVHDGGRASGAAELQQLLSELKIALDATRGVRPEVATRVGDAAEAVSVEVSRPKPDESRLRVTAEGLKAAASALKDIAPDVLSIAGQIANYVSRIVPM